MDEGRYDGRRVLPSRLDPTDDRAVEGQPQLRLPGLARLAAPAQRRYNSANPAFVPAAEPFAADDVVYFDGAGAQRVYIIPSRKMVILRMGKADNGWDDSRLPNLVMGAFDGACRHPTRR